MSSQFDNFQNEILRSMLLEIFHISIVISLEYKKKMTAWLEGFYVEVQKEKYFLNCRYNGLGYEMPCKPIIAFNFFPLYESTYRHSSTYAVF